MEWRQKTHKGKQNKLAEEYVSYKGKGKIPEEQLSEVKLGNLPEKEFRITIVKMIQDLRKRMAVQSEETQEMFNKEIEDLKNNQTLMNTVTETKNALEGINSRINEAEEQKSELEDRLVEIATVEQIKKKRHEGSLWDLWNEEKNRKDQRN